MSLMESFSRCVVASIGFCLMAVIAGCGSKTEVPPTDTVATPVANRASGGDNASLPSDDNLLQQIDDALEYTYDHRRLSVGSTSNDQAAWQIVHGALAFKREFLVSDGGRDVSAVEYI